MPLPPNKGDKIRSHHLLRTLAAQYRVFLGTFVDDAADWALVPQLSRWCEETKVVPLHPRMARLRSLRGLVDGQPLTIPYYWSDALADWVRTAVVRHGIRKALVFSSGMVQYLQLVPQVEAVIDFVDVDSVKWAQYAQRRAWPLSAIYRREAERLLAYERSAAARARAACFVTSDEEDLFKRIAPECAAKTLAVSNGVDADYFSPAFACSSPYPAGVRAIVLTGAMNYWPNADAACWFAREVMPLLRFRVHDVRFYIVGMNPSRVVRELARDDIVVTGTVDDVRPYLRHAALAVAPLHVARGVQNKVLEAMAMGLPVIATTEAVTGLLVQRGVELHVADDPQTFARYVFQLLRREGADAMGVAARARILRSYTWEANLAPLQRVLAALHSSMPVNHGPAGIPASVGAQA